MGEGREGGARPGRGGKNEVRGENEMGSERQEEEIRRAIRGRSTEIGGEEEKYGGVEKKSKWRVKPWRSD